VRDGGLCPQRRMGKRKSKESKPESGCHSSFGHKRKGKNNPRRFTWITIAFCDG